MLHVPYVSLKHPAPTEVVAPAEVVALSEIVALPKVVAPTEVPAQAPNRNGGRIQCL